MSRIMLIAVAVLVASVPALAQDVGTPWIDRVTHELQTERGPLQEKPVDFHAWGGVAYQYDSNIYFEEDDEDSDSIIIPFARARLEYAEQRFDVTVDGMYNYKFYSDEDDADDHEERLYVRARQADARYSFEIAEILTRQSDPIDAVFADRVARVVSTTVGRAAFDLTEAFFFEVDGTFNVVRYQEDGIDDTSDNNSARASGSLGWRTPYGWDVLAQAGWFGVFYSNDQLDGAPPDADGVFVRGGFRGEIFEDLSGEVFVGWTSVDTDSYDFPVGGSTEGVEHSTTDASAQLRYQATETVEFTAGYTRMITFTSTALDPWQVNNHFIFRGLVAASEQVDIWGRVQYSYASSAQGINREYWSVGGGGNYVINEYLVIDASISFRAGETEGSVVTSTEYDGFIASVGLAFTY